MSEAEDFDNKVNQAIAPKENGYGEPIVVGCNYHTTWQSNKGMRFILRAVRDKKAFLGTRTTGKYFPTNLDTLIFIRSEHNIRKANRLRPNLKIKSDDKI